MDSFVIHEMSFPWSWNLQTFVLLSYAQHNINTKFISCWVVVGRVHYPLHSEDNTQLLSHLPGSIQGFMEVHILSQTIFVTENQRICKNMLAICNMFAPSLQLLSSGGISWAWCGSYKLYEPQETLYLVLVHACYEHL